MKTANDIANQVSKDLQNIIPKISSGELLPGICSSCRNLIITSFLELLDKQQYIIEYLSGISDSVLVDNEPLMIAVDHGKLVEVKGKNTGDWIWASSQYLKLGQVFRVVVSSENETKMIVAECIGDHDDMIHGRVIKDVD